MPQLKRLKMLETFCCLAENCPQTCCTNWNIPLFDIDIKYYQKKPGVLGNLRKNFDFVNKTLKCHEGRCMNLTQEGLCKLHVQSTFKALPTACKLYPRVSFSTPNIFWEGASLSCPEIVNQFFITPQIELTQKQSKVKNRGTLLHNTTIPQHEYKELFDILGYIERNHLEQFFLEYTVLYSKHHDPLHELTVVDVSNIFISIITILQKSPLGKEIDTIQQNLQDVGVLSERNFSPQLFIEQMAARFLELPVDVKHRVQQVFANLPYMISFSLIQKKSIKEMLLWQSFVTTSFLFLGLWSIPQDEENWKAIMYKLGRLTQNRGFEISDLSTQEKFPLLLHFLYYQICEGDKA